jgi:hypothetical protein
VLVNLKRFLWTADKGIWEQHASGTLDTIWCAFAGKRWPLTIQTIPQQVARRGLVIVSEGQARGEFRCVWPDLAELASTLTLLDEKGPSTVTEAEYLNWLPHLEGQTIGVAQRFSLVAATFEELLAGIGEEERTLLLKNQEAWQSLQRHSRMPSRTR